MRIVILAILSISACGPKGEVSSDLPVNAETTPKEQVSDKKPVVEDESTSSVVGRYEELNVKQKDDGVPRYVGRVVIVTDEGERILLETHEEGIRTEQEIETFRNKRVIVEGNKIEKRCQAWGDFATAAIVGPCIRSVRSIALETEP